MKNLVASSVALAASLLATSLAHADSEKYLLRYKFTPNESIRWQIEHRSMVRATVSGTTQSTETLSNSVNVWRVAEIKPDGVATFQQSVQWIDMRQTLTGRSEVHYDSRTGEKPPRGFEDASKSVGVPLATITIDARGKVLSKKSLRPGGQQADSGPGAEKRSWITLPLPEKAVAIGESWSLPQDIELPLPNGTIKKIKSVQRFVLEEVRTGVALIRVSTEVLTPISDPALESQLVEREAAGTVRFDVDAGRIIGQQMDIDKQVVGFRGGASSLHYVNRFSERLLSEPARR
jgi:hypothetical protein